MTEIIEFVEFSEFDDRERLTSALIASGSSVLDLGCGRGTVARALHDRGCRVWGIDRDRESVAAARRWCERIIHADLETIDLSTLTAPHRFDVVLCLELLPYLHRPDQLLREAQAVLAQDGRIIFSAPNVTHAAARLELLNGRYTRTTSELLNRAQLHLYDRDGVEALCRDSRLAVTKWMNVRRPLGETDVPVDTDQVPVEVVRMAQADPESEIYHFVVSAVPGQGNNGGAGSATEENDRDTTDVARTLRAQVTHLTKRLHDREQAAASRSDQEAREIAHLRRDVLVKDAYLAELRETTERLYQELQHAARARQSTMADQQRVHEELRDRNVQLEAELEDMRQTLDRVRTQHQDALASIREHEAASRRIDALEAELAASRGSERQTLTELSRQQTRLDELRHSVTEREQNLEDELARYRGRLAQPRYRLVDSINRGLKRLPPLHRSVRWIVMRLWG